PHLPGPRPADGPRPGSAPRPPAATLMLCSALPLHRPDHCEAVAPDPARGWGNPPARQAGAKPAPSHRRLRPRLLAVHRTTPPRRAGPRTPILAGPCGPPGHKQKETTMIFHINLFTPQPV